MSSYKYSVKPSIPVLQSIRVLDQLRERIGYMQYSLSIGQVGTEIQTVAELLVHSDVSTTMICNPCAEVAAGGTVSLLDALGFDP